MNKSIRNIALAALTTGLVSSAAFATDESFDATIKLLAPIVITETATLRWADTVSGSAVDVVTLASDANAAQFTATGEANTAVTGSVVESTIEMTTGDGVGSTKRMTVKDFTTGGDLSGAGAATFNGSGQLNDLRIGGTAEVQADDIAGTYVGSATFRLIYN